MSPQRDSISSLPDEVLGKVLSLLPTKQAASTLVLSKRWRNLLSLVDSLDLSDDATATGDPSGFPDFVDKTLALLTNSSIIKRFSLRCEHTHDASRVDNWIRTVLERRSFSELHLESVTSRARAQFLVTRPVFHLYCKSMPVFHKLLTLSFESDKEKGWQVVPLLLNNSPNLETLVIKGLVHRVTDRYGDACVCVARKNKEEEVCCLSTCQVKVLKVSGYRGTRRELNQMKHFLGNLKCLETVKVDVEVESHREDKNVNKNYQRIINALTKLPRASSNPFLLIYPLCN
ncbi:hypothetical protein BRARA_D01780 [Brassica rapa]|uniref:F-box domain-containing protein n=1 Tax=Brassica campestris TaxID=3711 RepID=A0A397ZNT5_BRACM|nr:hypothetical protein BRARA_D01780 [Brassica rapa]